jgi:hypothetical protein
MSKLNSMSRFVPGLYRPTTNVHVKGLLYAWSGEDDQIVQAIQDAKEQIYVKLAKLQYLDSLGSNVGVFRPSSIGLADEQYRELIPALSFYPKQVVPTIKKVLEVFFGAGNPRVAVFEVNPNEIVIQIPSSVPALRRTLKGSNHFHSYAGTITAIDNIVKTLTVNFHSSTQNLIVDELAGATFGVGAITRPILSNQAGYSGVVIQFAASSNLLDYTVGDSFNIADVTNYPGSFVPDIRKTYTVTKQRGILGQSITAGNIYPTLTMQDASGIPDGSGRLIFSYGRGAEEVDIKYFGRPNNTTLLLDPSYTFLKNHSIGEVVNVIVKPYQEPAQDGTDLSVFLVGVEAARILAQQIVESVVAAGVVVRWIVLDPEC